MVMAATIDNLPQRRGKSPAFRIFYGVVSMNTPRNENPRLSALKSEYYFILGRYDCGAVPPGIAAVIQRLAAQIKQIDANWVN